MEGNFLISSNEGKGTIIYMDFKLSENIDNKKNGISLINQVKENLICAKLDKRKSNKAMISSYYSLEDFKKLNFGPKDSYLNEKNFLQKKPKSTKTAKELKMAKLTELSIMSKEDNKIKKNGEKYKINICSTNNILKFYDLNENKNENIGPYKQALKNYSNIYLRKGSLNHLESNSSSNIHISNNMQNYNSKINNNDNTIENKNNFINNNCYDKKFSPLKTKSLFDSNDDENFDKTTITDRNTMIFNYDCNFTNNYNHLNRNNFKKKISKVDSFKKILIDSRLNNNKKKFYKKSKTYNCHYNAYKGCTFEKTKLIKQNSNQYKSIKNRDSICFPKHYFSTMINTEKNLVVKILEDKSRRKTKVANANTILDSEKFEKNITATKNFNNKIMNDFKEIEKIRKSFNPRKSILSVIIPNEIYQEMKLNSSNIFSLSDYSPNNLMSKIPGSSSSQMQRSKNTKILSSNNSQINLKNSFLSKHNISVLFSNSNTFRKSFISINNNINENIINNNFINDDHSNYKNNLSNKINDNSKNYKNKLRDSLISKSIVNTRFKNEKLYRFMIVDDEMLIRRSQKNVIEKYFRKKNVNIMITECSDGAECLFKLYEGNLKGIEYDMIFTDETMLLIRGTDMARIVKTLIKENILYEIKIFMITSYDRSIIENENGNTNKDIDYFFTKPLSIFSLDKAFAD